jgi:hypothetical protein
VWTLVASIFSTFEIVIVIKFTSITLGRDRGPANSPGEGISPPASSSTQDGRANAQPGNVTTPTAVLVNLSGCAVAVWPG